MRDSGLGSECLDRFGGLGKVSWISGSEVLGCAVQDVV